MRPTEDIYLHLGGDGTYSLKPDLIPGEAGSLNKSSRCAGPGSARQNRGVLAPYYDYIRPQLSSILTPGPGQLYARTRYRYFRMRTLSRYVTVALIKNRCTCWDYRACARRRNSAPIIGLYTPSRCATSCYGVDVSVHIPRQSLRINDNRGAL